MLFRSDEDDDDGLKGYVDAEDDAAYEEWLKDDGKTNGKYLSKGDFLKRRDARWAEIMSTPRNRTRWKWAGCADARRGTAATTRHARSVPCLNLPGTML